MPTALSALADDWIYWLNGLLADCNPRLHACLSPDAFEARNDPTITKTCLHVRIPRTHGGPVMIGLLSTASTLSNQPHEDGSDGMEDNDDSILAQDVLHDQLLPFRSTGPFLAFLAHGRSKVTFYECESLDVGLRGDLDSLMFGRAYKVSFERGKSEQEAALRRTLIDAVRANMAKIGEAAMLNMT